MCCVQERAAHPYKSHPTHMYRARNVTVSGKMSIFTITMLLLEWEKADSDAELLDWIEWLVLL